MADVDIPTPPARLDPRDQEYELVPIDSIEPHPDNPNQGDDDGVGSSIATSGFYGALICQRSRRRIIAGHTRWRADKAAGAEVIPVIWVDVDDDRARVMMLGDNEWARKATTNEDLLAKNLQALLDSGTGLDGTGYDDAYLDDLLERLTAGDGEGDDPDLDDDVPAGPSLVDRFVIPPFTVLDARQGYWLERKRRWLGIGIRSEVGRGGNMAVRGQESSTAIKPDVEGIGVGGVDAVRANAAATDGEEQEERQRRRKVGRGEEGGPIPGGGGGGAWLMRTGDGRMATSKALTMERLSGRVPDYYQQKRAVESALGRELTNAEFEADHLVMPEGGGLSASGTSVFDPVLCELAYRWFSPEGGTVLDPFAGGSVRGVVAAALGRRYTGVELRTIQVEANRDQWADLAARLHRPGADGTAQRPAPPTPTWIEGDSAQVVPTMDPDHYDLLFSCPPYADLEVYSDDLSDISNMPWPQFLDAYRAIIAAGVQALAPHRFAVWVIGDVRGPDGSYRGLVAETIRAFADAGATLYNEAILVTPLGSLQVRVGRQFDAGRKMGKTHQNVLTFVKGDPAAAVRACGHVDVAFPEIEDDYATDSTGQNAPDLS